MEWNGFYLPIYCSLFPNNNYIFATLRSQEFSSFYPFNIHLCVCVCIYIYTYKYIYTFYVILKVIHLHRKEGIVPAVETSRYFIPSLTTKFPVSQHNSYRLTIHCITVCSTVSDRTEGSC